jgi:hypothetical protein
MSNSSIDQASRLDEIGFPEFTAQLIGDTFDALISANIRQQETYLTMVKEVSKSLTDYINQTKDDISGAEILQFIQSLPSPAGGTNPHFAQNYKLTAPDAEVLNKAVAITGVVQPAFAANDELKKQNDGKGKWDILLDAAAKRIAANKYDLLKDMLKQGMLRLVVEHGYLETRLTFNTWEYQHERKTESEYERERTSEAKLPGVLSFITGPSVRTGRKMTVKTANTSNTDSSGTNISIFGGVKLYFKTDYLPLNTEI